MAIKNIIFDFGNVLFTVDTGAHIQFLESMRKAPTVHGARSRDLQDLVRNLEAGIIPESLFFAAWSKLEFDKFTAKDLNKAWNEILGVPIFEQEEILRPLKANYNLALLSNTNSIHLRAFEKPAFPLLRHFKHRYYSFQIGFCKPDLHAFAYVLKERGFEPRETLMIDDRPENITAAMELGMPGICLADPMQLEEELLKAGVELGG